MIDVTIVGFATSGDLTPVGATGITLGLPPEAQAGDFALAFISVASGGDLTDFTPPAGWERVLLSHRLGGPDPGNDYMSAAVYQRTLDVSDAPSGTWTWQWPPSTRMTLGAILVLRGESLVIDHAALRPGFGAYEGPPGLILRWDAAIRSGSGAALEVTAAPGTTPVVSWSGVANMAALLATEELPTGGLVVERVPTYSAPLDNNYNDGFATILVSEELIVSPRIRSHVSEDAGSLFQATNAVAVELGISEAFEYGTDVGSGLRSFREALTPNEVAVRYYPLPTRNQEMLVTVEGETNLGRMARVYPSAIMTRVADIPGHSGDTMTAQQAIQYVFNRWASEFPWFRPLPVPDLRLLVGGAVAAPRQYYIDNPEAGVLTTEAIVIPQDGDNRRTMREIVDEWLSIFPGTIVRQDSQGRVELVPRVGPDAPDEALTLEWRDILSISDGEDDPRGVYNVGRTTSQGWEWREDQAVVPPLYVLATRSDGLTPEAMEEVTDDLSAEPLVNGGEREFEVFVEPDTPLDVDLTFSAWSASNPSGTGGLLEEVNLSISFDVALGQTRVIEFSWFIFGVDNEKTFAHVTRTERGLKVRVVGDRYQFGPNPVMGLRYVAYLLEVTAVTGTAWTRSNEAVTAEFSLANGDSVPGPDGSNALATSTALYGEREATIRSDVFQLTPEQAQAVAQGFVLFNINPRTIRDVQQSEWNRYPVKFDHIGRLVDLPNGERAVVENRNYSDSFAPNGGFMLSAFTATVSELVIDTTTEYLYLDDGNYMRLDDGSLVEAS